MFERYRVRVLGLSRDDVADADRMHRESELGVITLLADPELEVIRRLGLVHEKAVVTSSPLFRLFGLPIGVPNRIEAMAIPTTVLIDEAGIVRWIDQADDYRIRSDAQRVEAALCEVFDPGPSDVELSN